MPTQTEPKFRALPYRKSPRFGDFEQWVEREFEAIERALASLTDRAVLRGSGTPEGAVTADIGTIYLRTDGSTSTTLYVKTASDGANTGWTAK